MKKKIASLLALFTLVFSMVGSIASVSAQSQATPPATTKVHVTKVVWDNEEAAAGFPKDGTGEPMTIGDFGTGATFLAGAQFDYWKIEADVYADLMGQNVTPFNSVAPSGTPTGTITTTGANGHAEVDLPEGYYWFKEREIPGVTTYIATSFGVVLPFATFDANDNHTGYLTDLWVYPKNVSTITVDKTVGDLVTNTSPYDIGEEITYYVEARIPAGNITAFTLTDTLSTGLEFVANSGQLYFSMVADPDLSTMTGQAIGGTTPTFDVLATDATNLNANKGGYVYISYKAKITDDAVVATDIENEITLNISRDGQPTVRTDDAFVHTGGKKFIKENRSNGNALAGAKFVIKNGDGAFYQYNATDNVVAWVTDSADATELVSGADGRFEIKGLAYGADGSAVGDGATTYYLYETSAPTGFVIPSSLAIGGTGTAFEVSATSYTEGEVDLEVQPTGTIVNNTQAPVIPNTGGIGAIVFIVGGLTVIALALVGIRKRMATK